MYDSHNQWQGDNPNPHPWSDDPNSPYRQFNRNYMGQTQDIDQTVDMKKSNTTVNWLVATGAIGLAVLILAMLSAVFTDNQPTAEEIQHQKDVAYCKDYTRKAGFEGAFESCMGLRKALGGIDEEIERDVDRQVEEWERKHSR